MSIGINGYGYLFLLLLLPLAAFLLYRFKKWRAQRQELFAEDRFRKEFFPKDHFFSKVFPVLYLLALLFLILAMVDLVGNSKQMKLEQKTNSVIFLLDVSNSMNAQDVQPSRLEMAKALIINSVRQVQDGRVGVVVFAGDAQSIMPLTRDYDSAETYLSIIETSIIGKQGTDFLKAVQEAVKKLKNIPKGARKIILISDGEDNEGNENASIDEARKEGVAINCVSLGTEEGAPIPEYVYGQLMGYKADLNGETVITKKQSQALLTMANETQGTYIDGNNLERGIAGITKILKEKGSGATLVDAKSSVHYYQWFLGVSLFLFSIIYLFNPKKDLNN